MNGSTATPGSRPTTSESPRFRPPGTGGIPLPDNEREFRRELARRLCLLRREIHSLRAKAKTVDPRSGRDYVELLDSLEARALRLEFTVETFDRADADRWPEFRSGAEETWRDLKQSLLRIGSLFWRRHPESRHSRRSDGLRR